MNPTPKNWYVIKREDTKQFWGGPSLGWTFELQDSVGYGFNFDLALHELRTLRSSDPRFVYTNDYLLTTYDKEMEATLAKLH